MAKASDLPLEDKRLIVESIILPLRGYQMLGIVEARDWLEALFPEFGEVRDREADQAFKEMAELRNPPRDPAKPSS